MYLCAHTFVCEIIYLINDSLDLSFYRGQELGYCCKSKTWHSVHSRLWTPSSVREWVWMPYQVDPTSAYRCRLPKPPGATERFERALSDVGLKVVWAIDDGADWWLLILTLPCIKRPSPKTESQCDIEASRWKPPTPILAVFELMSPQYCNSN